VESSKIVNEQAARWLVKLDSGDWSDSDQTALKQWLESSTAHVVAYVRLETAWKRTRRLKSLGAGIAPGRVPSPDEWQLSPFYEQRQPETRMKASKSAQRAWLGALAAGIAIASIFAAIAYFWPFGPSYRTPVGGIASVPMTDGSKVTLNTASEIRVAVTETERRVELEQGEAYFEVAKDPHRPFVVTAGNERVIAVGTAFSVRRDPEGIRVAVTDGKVKVEQAEKKGGNSTRPATASPVLVAAGSVALTLGKGVLVKQKPVAEVEEYLSWRTGYLTFHDTTLAEAVQEFNRYNTRQIVVQDPSIAAIRLSGKFESTKYEAFIRLLEKGYAIRAQPHDDRIDLSMN
jgi:transmembrane sensor